MTSHDRSCISSTSSVFLQNCDWNCYPASVTGTKGPVITSHGPVQFQLFSSHSNWTFKHYSLLLLQLLQPCIYPYLFRPMSCTERERERKESDSEWQWVIIRSLQLCTGWYIYYRGMR